MTNEKLKKKIIEILEETEYEWTEEKNGYILQIFYDKLADALIAAGIGDVSELKKHRVQIMKDGTIQQFYSGKEVEQIVKERDEYKHRAEVTENELKLYKLAVKIWQERYSDIRCFNFNIALRQAEKELAEERKDE